MPLTGRSMSDIRLITHRALDEMSIEKLESLGAHGEIEKHLREHHVRECIHRARSHDEYLLVTYKNEPQKLLEQLDKFYRLHHRIGFWFKILVCESCGYELDAFDEIDKRIKIIIASINA